MITFSILCNARKANYLNSRPLTLIEMSRQWKSKGLLTGWGLGPARFIKCTLRVFFLADPKIRIWPEFKSRCSRGVMNNLQNEI